MRGYRNHVFIFLATWASLLPVACPDTRHKRQILSEQPRILTDNGNLVFQSGVSRNITFRSGQSSAIYFNNVDLSLGLLQITSHNMSISSLNNRTIALDAQLLSLRSDLNGAKRNLSRTSRSLSRLTNTSTSNLEDLRRRLAQVQNLNATLNLRIQALETRFEGLVRNLTINECASGGQCLNGGSCIDLYNDFYCLCPPQWKGKQCQTDVDECLIYGTTACQNGGTCVNTLGSYNCRCPHDWFGPTCSEQHDDCRGSNALRCGKGTCVDLQRNQSGQPHYQCVCYPGYTLDTSWQPRCVDIDECHPLSGQRYPCSTVPHVVCVNTPGHFRCEACPPGYDGNGAVCTPSDRCMLSNGGCSPNARCYAPYGYPISCQCNNGYVGNGFGPDGCALQTLAGACRSSPCQNGGICELHSQDTSLFVCRCAQGYAGPTCADVVLPCSSNPCQNGQNCTNRNGGYVCTCNNFYTGFNCERQQSECGNLEGESGSMQYPLSSTYYNPATACTHRISTVPGKILTLNFTRFDLEAAFCRYDYLDIFDGPSSSSSSLGRFCGSTLLGRLLTTTQHQVTLDFTSDQYDHFRGFSISWTSSDPVCGGIISGLSQGNITSPNYPHAYPPGSHCVWRVAAAAGSTIRFTIQFVDLACSNGFIKIYDGEDESSLQLLQICDSPAEQVISTTSPFAFVRFYSNYSTPQQGFSIPFQQITGQSCGGELTQTSGSISINNPDRLACAWSIRVPEGYIITLSFLTFQQPCQNGLLTVRDGINITSPDLSRLCGNTVPGAMNSTGNTMLIIWHSTTSNVVISAQYNAVCGGKFVGDSGTFKTPTVYSASICTYQIEVPAGKTILLKLSDDPTHLNPIRHICDLNIVLSETGFGSDSVTYPCLENVPTEYRSSGNQLFITYDTESENLLSFIANFSSVEGRGCGGYLNGDQGFFQSPGFPESYIHNENCTWYITVSPGHVVRLTFQAFNLEYHSNCLFDYVDVYDSDTPLDNRKLNRFCGQTIPPAQTSTSNVMVVQLRSDHSIVGRGFQASYIARNDSFECGGTLVAPSGSIKSPNYPSSSPAGVSCEWVINVSPGMQIVLNVSDFDVQDYRCLEIRNGGYQTSPLLILLCQPPSGLITSHTNQLYIKYRTGYYSRGNGFYLQYYALASGCGGEFTAFRGIFQSPNYPDPYPPNSDCQWTIRVAQGSKIILSFDSHFGVHCYGNYIEVPEGRRKTKHLCGYYPPAPVTFTNNLVVIKFRSSPYARGIGFRASYVADCNNRLNGTFGAIESPNFPNPYPHEIDCLWTIDVPLGNKINSHFGLFKLEDKHNGVCNYDYVEVRGSNLTNNKFCGEDAPVNNFLSNANTLAVQFHSDSSLSHLGFKLEWIIEGCGETFNLNTGIITSPNYPRSYNNSQTCIWDITVSEGNVVNLTLTDFDVETHSNCYFDGLFVYSEDISEEPIVTLCHTQNSTQSVTSESNHMIVLFKSDSSVVGRGFNAIFNAVQRTCGKDFTTRSGTLTSKNYPNAYDVRNSVECSWTIKVEANHIVNLTFSELDLNCQNDDFIDIYSGENSLGTPLASSLCQLGNTSFYLSESNQMFIRMRIHYSWYNSHKGFRATYITACGGTLDADEGIIMSPFFPGRYNRNSDCVWHITRTPVYLTFSHMDIPDYNPCTTSYLFLSYGENNNTYCGQAVPRPIYSENSPIMVNFHSGYLFGTGFKAKFSTYLTCSGNLTALTGSFVSPHYPQDYPDDTECTWQITASPGNSIQLNFNEFELTGERNNDYLEIHSPNQAGPVVGRWFGNQGPGTITGLTGAWILFRSDYSGHSKGFLAEYVQVCGGTLTNASGQIASLLYPSQYPSNIHCMWTIIVQENKTIQITFDDFNIHSSQFGSNDVLMILDGDQFSSSLGMYSNSNRPPSFLRSTSNVVTVIFHSDYYNQLTGFLLSWITVSSTVSTTAGQECRGDFIANSTVQVLTSPDYPNLYANNLNCFWTITAPLGKRVSITINNMSLEGTSYYCHDYLQFHNALNQPAVTGRKCSDDIVGRAIYSSSNSLGITFVSDFSIRDQGFYITYHEDCGSTYTGVSSGIIQSTNYSNNYSPNQDCTWQVTARTGKTIKLDFTQPFDIAGSAPCQQDYLKLFNGPTSSSPPLILNGSTNINGTYCGQTAPQGLETSSNQLFVQFVSDGSGSGAGFSFTFSEVSITCGGTLTLTDSLMTGFFTSPNYPNDYPHNVDCTWRIIAPALTRIRVDFVDTFFIEDHNNCTFDYIEFRDGSSFNSPRIGQPLCGTRLPSTIYSNSNLLFVRFRTDDSVGHEGFKVKYSRATCGGRIASTSGTITSPNFPSNYRNNDECEWELQGAVGHYLYFTLDTLSFPQTENCTDFLMIRDGNATDTILFNSCTDQSISQNTSDNKAYVQFKADGTLVDRGFKFHFDSSLEECGGNLYLSSGEFTSPNFPNLYSNRRTCVWSIFAPQDRRITLTFTDFDLENDWSCSFDFIHVWNGLESDSPSLGRFCGDVIPPVFKSSGNALKVMFRTDHSSVGHGFRAVYNSDEEIVCGGDLTETTGFITSPQTNETHNLQCIWRILQQAPSTVRLSFNEFNLEQHGSCAFDFLEIRSGADRSGELIGRYCGSTKPKDVLIQGSNIWVMYRSDQSVASPGFNLTYKVSSCGGVLRGDGALQVPVFPEESSFPQSCIWTIEYPEGSQIVIRPARFNLSCADGFLSIQNGGFSDSPFLNNTEKYCNITLPAEMKSHSNVMRLTGVFNRPIDSRSGFSLNYVEDQLACGGLQQGTSGWIKSPNYPRSYPHNIECRWDILVDSGFYIMLQFDSPFDIAHDNCEWDYLELFNVLQDGTEVSLGRSCSNIAPVNISSSLNKLVVKFRSDDHTNGLGFSLHWSRACGGVYTAESGVVTSPNYPNNYYPHTLCTYLIKPGDQKLIKLQFTDMQLARETRGWWSRRWNHFYCQNEDNVLVQLNTAFGNYRRICRFSNQVFHSQGWLKLIFEATSSETSKGFSAQYESSDCGGYLNSTSGVIQPHSFHGNFTGSSECFWTISVESNKVVLLKFSTLFYTRQTSCIQNYIEIFDGPNTTSPSLGTYCSQTYAYKMVRSSNSTMLIKYVTAPEIFFGSRQDYPFNATYLSTYGPASGCGGTLNQTQGTITAPNIANTGQNEPGLYCIWDITVGEDKIVSLNITNINIPTPAGCETDYILVKEGLNDFLGGKYCGALTPISLKSTKNTVKIILETSALSSAATFTLTFAEQNRICGGFVNASSPSQVISPGYPNTYGQPVLCSWLINVPRNNEIQINMTSRLCSGGATLYVTDEPLVAAGQNVDLCDPSLHDPFYSLSESAKVLYNGTSTSKFSLDVSTAGCQRSYSQPSGRIFSSGFPFSYQNNHNCTYTIQTANNTSVALYFREFNLEAHPNCVYDLLTVKNSSSQVVATLCGRTLPNPVFLRDNRATLQFLTDISVGGMGFDLIYIASTQGSGCGGNLTGLSYGVFTSPEFPNRYLQNQTCSWYISPHRTSYFKFDEVSAGLDCDTSYVAVYQGTLDTDPLISTYCNVANVSPRQFSSSIMVQYISTGNGTAPVFKFTFAPTMNELL